jgi:hypothetical protein
MAEFATICGKFHETCEKIARLSNKSNYLFESKYLNKIFPGYTIFVNQPHPAAERTGCGWFRQTWIVSRV